MSRIVLFTGKGGVGKTTVAAATASLAARRGTRTLVLSTDPAHSLADAFGIPLATEVSEMAPNLWGQQLDAQDRMEASWGEIRTWLVGVLDWAGVDAIEAEELAVVPGLDELFALTDIGRFAATGDYDLIVVDCAPTAETIRFLSLPDVLSWYMDRLFPATRRVNKVVGPVLKRVAGVPAADDRVLGATERLYDELRAVKVLLSDTARASVRLVVNPERIVIAEARRTYTYLSLFGYAVDAVVANRVLPASVADPFFDRWKTLQAGYLDDIADAFAPLTVLRADLADDELVGLEALEAFGAELYRGNDVDAVLCTAEPLRVRKAGDTMVLEVDLPFTRRSELELGRHGDELLIRVGPYRRALLLPDALRRRRIDAAALEDGCLRVVFGSAGVD